VLEAAEDPNSALARSLGIRQAVRVAQVRMDTEWNFATSADLRTKIFLPKAVNPIRIGCALATLWPLSRASNCALQAKRSFLLPTQFHRRFLLHLMLVALEAMWTYVLNLLLLLLLKNKTRDLGNDPAFLDRFRLYLLRLWFPALIFPSSMNFYLLYLKQTMVAYSTRLASSKFLKNHRRFQGRARGHPQVLDQVNSKFMKNKRRFRARGSASSTEAPYFTEDFLWDVEPLTRTVRECRLRKMVNGIEEYEIDTDDDDESDFAYLRPADVFLTGKAVRSEIKLKDLSPENRAKFLASMEKEWTSWMKFNAVEILTPAQILSLPGDVRIIGTRWVHTDKNQKQRLLALHLCHKTGKSREQVTKEYPFAAKSRLVVQGHQEDASDLRTDSPTASLLAFNLVSAVAVLKGRSWWKKLFKTLRKNGWRMSAIEPALFILADGSSLLGVLITHVDDLYSCGEGEAYDKTLKEMEQDGSIFLDQMDSIEGIDYMVLPTERRKNVNGPLTDAEKSAFRALIGQMGWVVRQSRPDLMVNVSLAAQAMGNPKIRDVVALNKAVKHPKDSSEHKWCFRKCNFTLEEAIVFSFADSSFGNVEGGKSQCGFVVGLTTRDVFNGDPVPILILETYSGSIKRVCRSTLAAEANGFLAGTEAAEYLRMLLMELIHPDVQIRDLDNHYLKEKIAMFTDARSLEQSINKDTGQPADKRVRILLAQVKEMIGENPFEDDAPASASWVDTSQMLTDVLTKEGCDREPLLHALAEGEWQLRPSEAAQEKKLLIRAGRHVRKAARARAEDGC
ncbi:GIP, partial [Symbiodinium pilosum]